MSPRTVEVMFFDGCPNVDLAVLHARAALASAGLDGRVEIAITRIDDDLEAARKRFLGSPTVQVDGLDVDPDALTRDDYGLQCRIYWHDGRIEGAPPIRWIAAALAADPPIPETGLAEPSAPASSGRSEHGCCSGKSSGRP
jgi:hypothetical protein